jgi:hypothetical protein
MAIIDDLNIEGESHIPEMEENAPEVEKSGSNDNIISLLKSQTGEGNIEDYINHPLNFKKSKGMARILRGFEGIFGNLSLAFIDILIGSLEMMKENKAISSGAGHVGI